MPLAPDFPTGALVHEITKRIDVPNYEPGLGSRVSIPFPPVTTDLRLGELELNKLLRFVEIDTESAASLFGEFVEIFMSGEEPDRTPRQWIIEQAYLPIRVRRFFLSREDVMAVACTLLWIFGQSGLPMSLSADELVIETEYGPIGFRNGVILSDFESLNGISYPPIDIVAKLNRIFFDRIGICSTVAFNRIWRVAHQHPERDALKLALQILYWRIPTTEKLVEWFYDI